MTLNFFRLLMYVVPEIKSFATYFRQFVPCTHGELQLSARRSSLPSLPSDSAYATDMAM